MNKTATITPPHGQSLGQKQKRIREVDVLRGLAIILMITGHSFIVHPINIQEVGWCAEVEHWIYTFHMELFFLLAGCVYHCGNYRKYMSKKIDRLLVPYLFFGIISLLLHSVGLETVNKQSTIGDGIAKLLLRGGSYWFLYALFVLYLIYPLIEKVCKKAWMEFAVAAVCVVVLETATLPTLFTLKNVVYYLPYFVLGRYLVRLLQSDQINSHWRNVALLAVSMAVYIMLDRLFYSNPHVIVIKYVRAVAMILVVYVPLHYLLRWVDKGSTTAALMERFLDNCSTYSLQLYLFNGFLLVLIRTLVVTVMHIHSPAVVVTTIVAGNLIITLLICNFLLPKTKWLAWLCGTGKRPWN